MGSASITINVDGKWNGASALAEARGSLEALGNVAGASAKSVSKSLARQEASFNRLSRMAANTGKSTSQELSAIGEKVVIAGGKIYGVGEQMVSVGDKLTTSVTQPIMMVAEAAGKSAIEYDTAMANLRKVTDMTADELNQFGESAKKMAETQPVDAKTILNVEALGAQLGISRENLESFAKVATGLDIATNMNAEQAATEMARFANITGLSESELSNYGSTIVAIGNNMATTESEVSAMAKRLASAGTQAGMSSAEILGLSGAMSSLGIKAEMGGSAMSQTLVKIGKAVSSGGDQLQAFADAAGMSAEQFATAWRENATTAFTALLQGIHDSSEAGADMNETLSELGITGIRESDTMRRLAGSVDLVKQSVDLSRNAWEENAALQNEVDQRIESMASRLQVLRNKIENIAATVGVPLVNALIAAADSMQPVIDAVASAARAFADMDEGTQRMILGLVAAAAAAGPVLKTTGQLMQGLGSLTTGFGNVIRDAAAYSDAMNTVDGAQMRTYQSAETAATKLGLLKNKAVEAAGSVERYVSVWEENYRSTKLAESETQKLVAAQGKLDAVTAKLAASTDGSTSATARNVKNLQQQKAGLEDTVKSLQANVDAYSNVRDETGATLAQWQNGIKTTQSVAKETATLGSKMGGLVGSLKTAATGVAGYASSLLASIGPQIAITAAIAGVTAIVGGLVSAYQESKEYQDNLTESTKGLRSAVSDTSALDGYRGTVSAIGDDAGKSAMSVKDLADSTAKHVEAMRENTAQAEDQIAKLNTAQGIINKFAGQTDISASAQGKLEWALKLANEQLGTNITSQDVQNGQYVDANGNVRNLTDSINELIAKKKEEARVDALTANLTEAYAVQEDAARTLAQAQQDYNDKVEWFLRNSSATTRAQAEKMAANTNEARAVEDAAKQYDAASDAVSGLEVKLGNATAATSAAADEFDAWSASVSPLFIEQLGAAGTSIDMLKDDLRTLGADTTALGKLNQEQLTQLAHDYDGTAASIISDLESWGFKFDATTKSSAANASNIAAFLSGMSASAKGSLENSGIDLGNFARKMGDAGISADTLKQVGSTKLAELAASCNGDIDSMIRMLSSWNGKEFQDKYARAVVEHSSVDAAIVAGGNYNSMVLKDQWATMTVRQRYTSLHVRQNAEGGILKHAAGGIRKHADGYIARAAVMHTPVDMVGEAGAEAIVPLTNKRYALPFAKLISGETAKALASADLKPFRAPVQRNVTYQNTYTLTIDGTRAASNQRVEKAIQLIFNEFNTTADMGVC